MNDQARQSLCKLIGQYGSTLANTPRSCEMFVRQSCSAYPAEMNQFVQALQNGVVSQLARLPPGQAWDKASEPLVQQMCKGSGLGEPEARWTVDSWALALGKHPSVASTDDKPRRPVWEPDAEQTRAQSGGVAKLASMGAIGGALGGFVGMAFIGALFTMLVVGGTILLEEVEALEEFGVKASSEEVTKMMIILVIAAGLISALCGAIGGGAGGALIGGQSSAPLADSAELHRRLAFRIFWGAASGAFFASAVFGWLWGLLGITVFTLIGAASGSITAGFRAR